MKPKYVVSLIGLGILAASTALAAEFVKPQSGSQSVSLPASQTHHNLYLAGKSLNIASPTTGDLVVAGQDVSVSGSVESNVEAAGANLNLDGSIGQNLRAAGASINLNGKVGGDAVLAGAVVRINSQISGDVVVAGRSLTFGPNARVSGKVTYYGPRNATVENGAQVPNITYNQIRTYQGPRHVFKGLFALASIIKLIGLLILGLLMHWLMPAKVKSIVGLAKTRVWPSLGIGLAVFILMPIAAVLLMVTILGFYVGMTLLLAYLLFLIFASVLMLFYLGNLVYGWFKKDAGAHQIRDLLIGSLAAVILTFVPFIGWLAIAVALLITLGSLFTWFRKEQV